MSDYTDALKAGIKRVADLTASYSECLEKAQFGMAAIIRGELSAARAHLEGLTYAGKLLGVDDV